MARALMLAVLVSPILCCGAASAIPPPFVSDVELAKRPVIVVAKWSGAPWKDNSLVEGNVLIEHEVATEIEVQRVLAGEIKPGKHTVLVGFAIGWSKKLPSVTSYTSTEVGGDADAITPNIWLLSRKRSRVDAKEHLYLDSYRGVQPLALEPYFKALRTERLEDHVPTLLQSNVESVQLRTLEQIAGGDPPWPNEPWRFIRPKSKQQPLREQGKLVDALISDAKAKSVRRMAAAVYAHIEGERALPRMRKLVSDEDSEVRAIAIGVLAKHKELRNSDAMAQAVRGIKDPHMACELINRLRASQDIRAVPILIEFLQNDGFSYYVGNELGIPAIQAKEALQEMTGHAFPFDVSACRQAWLKAQRVTSREERKQLLAKLIPNVANPWKADLVSESDRHYIVVTNRSRQSRVLAKRPDDISLRFASGVFGAGVRGEEAEGKRAYVTCSAGASVRFELDVQQRDLFDLFLKSKSRSIDLRYMKNGNNSGVNAWIGVISIAK